MYAKILRLLPGWVVSRIRRNIPLGRYINLGFNSPDGINSSGLTFFVQRTPTKIIANQFYRIATKGETVGLSF